MHQPGVIYNGILAAFGMWVMPKGALRENKVLRKKNECQGLRVPALSFTTTTTTATRLAFLNAKVVLVYYNDGRIRNKKGS